MNPSAFDIDHCITKIFRQSTPLQQLFARVGLDRCEMKKRIYFISQNKIYRAVAQVAYSIKKNNVLVLDVNEVHVRVWALMVVVDSFTCEGVAASMMRYLACKYLYTTIAIPTHK